jgi:hypothetical protein
MTLEKIISGGQTGVDRSALDVALVLGIPHGGWCPRGRRAEDGQLDECYQLTETPSANYEDRTKKNVHEADGTLILVSGGLNSPGTRMTAGVAQRSKKPCLILDLQRDPPPWMAREWVQQHQIRILNVAGPRESKNPGIYDRAVTFLTQIFQSPEGAE